MTIPPYSRRAARARMSCPVTLPTRTSQPTWHRSSPARSTSRRRSRLPSISCMCAVTVRKTRNSILQIQVSATPSVISAQRTAWLRGPNLDIVEHRVLRRLAKPRGEAVADVSRGYTLTAEIGLMPGLMFRALAPMRMRNRATTQAVGEGIEIMQHAEASYWARMAIHCNHPRRVLRVVRVLLTETRPTQAGIRDMPAKRAAARSDRMRSMHIEIGLSTAKRFITALGLRLDTDIACTCECRRRQPPQAIAAA